MKDIREKKSEIREKKRKLASGLFFLLSLFSLFLPLVACGFEPVYGNHEHSAPVAAEMNAVAIDNIPDRSGQLLRNDLIDRIYGNGRPAETRYTLNVKLTISVQDLGVQANSTSTRSMMDTLANYTLTDKKSNKEVLKGVAHSVTSYNTLENQYGAVVSNESASERTINEVGEQIVNRLSLYFAERAKTNTAPTNLAAPPAAASQAVTMPVNPLLNEGPQ